MSAYLAQSAVIDWGHPLVQARAAELAHRAPDPKTIAKRCFEWVRDEIRHSRDYSLQDVPCSASEVLRAGSGYCFAKSHLLAALLRACSIPAGVCYQRLSRDDKGPPYCLHGFNGVFLPGIGWYRVDPRGNRLDMLAEFDPPREHLAFRPTLAGESNLPGIWAEPLPIVVEALQAHSAADLLWSNLPDRSVGVDEFDESERSLLKSLDQVLAERAVRSSIESIASRVFAKLSADSSSTMAWEDVPLEIYGPDLPRQIQSSWVFILRAGAATGAERHPNSIQRMMSFQGAGDLQTGGVGRWRSNLLVSDLGADLESRWICVPANEWHQAVVPNVDWVVVSFHTALAHELIEERLDASDSNRTVQRTYLSGQTGGRK